MLTFIVSDTQNPGISGFSTAHAYKYKTKRQEKIKRDSRKMTFLLISHQATLVNQKEKIRGLSTDHKRVKKIET